MSTTLFTASGKALPIGAELGKGGEGSVFEVPSLSQQVAKVYHPKHLPDADKAAKLAYMASTADSLLLNYAAWPQDTLHAIKGGPVVGFLMPKVTGKDPVHVVYSPAHRRQERPKAAWDYLLFTARNVAAAFDTLHKHGHVVGDVNQGNVMVGDDSRVMLIDSDSFQINERGTLHYCEVGVSHFTPPELQGLSSFKGFRRTPNHDNFGLALLIFHLLFGGRHPYSGVPLKAGVGDSLEGDIKAFRYAYGMDSAGRGLKPPPRTVPISLVPPPMQAMFFTAFTEQGASKRPTAAEWVSALDSLRPKLKKCSIAPTHVYPDHVSGCPWCALEREGVVYFLNLANTAIPVGGGFALLQVWALIEAVPPPPVVTIPTVPLTGITPAPLPSNIMSKRSVQSWRVALVIGIATLCGVAPPAWLVWLLLGYFVWHGIGSGRETKLAAEKRRRQVALNSAVEELDALVANLKKDAGVDAFRALKAELANHRNEHQQLPEKEKKELAALQSSAEARQRTKFLETCYLDTADIPGVGQARKAALRSFGIETAADVQRHRVMQVRGFGDSLTNAVMAWRSMCEHRFRFNPAQAVTDADKALVRQKIQQRRVMLEGLLARGPTALKAIRDKGAQQLANAEGMLTARARAVEQARADLNAFS